MREAALREAFLEKSHHFERADSHTAGSSGAPVVSREGAESAENFNGNITLDVEVVDREYRCAGAEPSNPPRGSGSLKQRYAA